MSRETAPISPVDRYLRSLHSRFIGLTDGAVADYIPPLAEADPEPFGICIATVDGQVYEVGDFAKQFTIQSISKPFTYGLAIEDRGLTAVLDRIGVEPSGDPFNEISIDSRGRPFNPMINAGAIMAASLVAGPDALGRVLAAYGRSAGRTLDVDETVFLAENETGHRNRAIGHMLRAVGTLDGDPERTLDLYFRQCSVNVTVHDLAIMAATLAARGRNPLTGERALAGTTVDHILSLMTTCGMYDAAGRWLVDVGMPAKSGVGGGVIGVLPGQLGIAVYSPRLDAVGNSVRGVAVFKQMSRDLKLHFLHSGRSSRSTVANSYRLVDVPSTRRRDAAQRAILEATGDACVVQELTGEILFSDAEAVTRRALEEPRDVVILDLRRAGAVDPAATRVLAGLGRALAEEGGELVLAAFDPVAATAIGSRAFADIDSAKEWCENRVLERAGSAAGPGVVTLASHTLSAGLTGEQLADLAGLVTPKPFAEGEVIVSQGEPATDIYLLIAGEVEVSTTSPDGGRRRLSTLTAGMVFGESAITNQALRTAEVRAVTRAETLVLDADQLAKAEPGLRSALLSALLATAHEALGRATREITALSR
jgi:glutaminase